jgi:hypothetical protein
MVGGFQKPLGIINNCGHFYVPRKNGAGLLESLGITGIQTIGYTLWSPGAGLL